MAAVMSDRYCIHSNQTKHFRFSAGDLLTCCPNCGDCNAGNIDLAWQYWITDGLVSGGPYGSNESCRPYEIAPCEHHMNGSRPRCGKIGDTPKCNRKCEPSFKIGYNEDKMHGQSAYSIDGGESAIQGEILANGPVEGCFMVYEDFF